MYPKKMRCNMACSRRMSDADTGVLQGMSRKSEVPSEVKGSPSLPRKCFTELTPPSMKLEEYFSQ